MTRDYRVPLLRESFEVYSSEAVFCRPSSPSFSFSRAFVGASTDAVRDRVLLWGCKACYLIDGVP